MFEPQKALSKVLEPQRVVREPKTPEAFPRKTESKKVFFLSFCPVAQICSCASTSALLLLRLPHFIQTVVSFSSDTSLRHEGPGRIELEHRNDGEVIHRRWSGPRKHVNKSHLFERCEADSLLLVTVCVQSGQIV